MAGKVHRHTARSAIVVSSYHHLDHALQQFQIDHVISILSAAEEATFPAPSFGDRPILRLRFDDVAYSSVPFLAPSRQQIAELIDFAQTWSGDGTLLVHCRAGSARSPAGALIAAAALRKPNGDELLNRMARARAYFRPNTAMLGLADDLLGLKPGLVDLVRRLPLPDHEDDWEPVRIPLD
jgi:predicted protein tyrosine phosphatase